MNPNHNIEQDLIANEALFSDEFFQQFTQRHDKQALKLTDAISKNYLFPTFYGDVTCAIGVFLCDYDKAQELLPDPRMKPVAMPRGRALVTFSCYEYQNVAGIAPYNEIAMTIPIMINPAMNVPVLPMVMESLFKNFGYYIFHMPVTSLENKIRGHKIWGLPKVVDTIDIGVHNGISKTSATDEAGHEYFSLSVPTSGKTESFDVCSNIYSKLDDRLLQSPTHFKGDFNVTKYMNRLWKKGGDDMGVLKIGSGPYAEMLENLAIEPQPFQFRYAAKMNACFDLPNEHYKAPFKFD